MGHSTSTVCEPVKDGLVDVQKLIDEYGGISIAGRYTKQKALESDYTFEMNWNAPKVIGTGLNGDVRLASDKDGILYAVKSFQKKKLKHKARGDMKNEVEIYLSVDHPHIARLEQVYETEEEIHLVMEHMAGGELYDRVSQKKQFKEEAAADTTHQMLLAVAYLHSRNICHRDLKLENFLYQSEDSDHLKLIDFGFAKISTGSAVLKETCGSLHYVAPEVLKRSYTSQADMWSVGVICHMLLTGSPVYRGADHEIINLAKRGKTRLSSRFGNLSSPAQDFVQALLVVDPALRLTAKAALEHPFVVNRSPTVAPLLSGFNDDFLNSFQTYACAPPFRQACLSMMAWSLSVEDRQQLHGKFLELDVQKSGTISLTQFEALLKDKRHLNSAEIVQLFAALDTDHDNKLCYSEFLAAVLQDHMHMHNNVLRRTFARFDQDASGVVTVESLRTVLGDTFKDVDVTELIHEADTTGSGDIRYTQFVQYMQKPETTAASRGPGESCSSLCSAVSLVDLLKLPEVDVVEQWPLRPATRKSSLSPKKMGEMPFHSSLMRAAAEAAVACVRQ
jgi:calcium-dependent protein kinase